MGGVYSLNRLDTLAGGRRRPVHNQEFPRHLASRLDDRFWNGVIRHAVRQDHPGCPPVRTQAGVGATRRTTPLQGSCRLAAYKGNTRGIQGERSPLVFPLYSPCIPLVISRLVAGLRPGRGGARAWQRVRQVISSAARGCGMRCRGFACCSNAWPMLNPPTNTDTALPSWLPPHRLPPPRGSSTAPNRAATGQRGRGQGPQAAAVGSGRTQRRASGRSPATTRGTSSRPAANSCLRPAPRHSGEVEKPDVLRDRPG
jgi:hypothetical protein